MPWSEFTHPGRTNGIVPVTDGVLVVRYKVDGSGTLIQSGVQKTSTSTIVYPKLRDGGDPFGPKLPGPDGGVPHGGLDHRLRMYDIPGNEVLLWFQAVGGMNSSGVDAHGVEWTPSSFYDPALVPETSDPYVASYLSWLDSSPTDFLLRSELGGASSRLSRGLSDAPIEFMIELGDTPLGRTEIPTRRVGFAEVFEQVVGYTDPSGYPDIQTVTDDVLAAYKDPCVVAIPAALGGGWLCLMARLRVQGSSLVPGALAAALADDNLDEQSKWDELKRGWSDGDLEPHNSVGDVVGWVCDDPSFSGNSLKGPFLFVSSIGQLADLEVVDGRASGPRFAPFRIWAGVPSATFLDDSLYLYCSGHPNGRKGSDAAGELSPYIDVEAGLKAAVEGFAGGAGFDQAILTRHITPEQFQKYVVEATPTPEADWTWRDVVGGAPGTLVTRSPRGSGFGHLSTVRGESIVGAMVPVRVWQGWPGSSRRCVALLDAVQAATDAAALEDGRVLGQNPPLLTDPAPTACGGSLQLYFSAVPGNGDGDLSARADTLHGLWRGAAVPASATIAVADGGGGWSDRTARFGVDFVVASANNSRRRSEDQVAQSWAAEDPGGRRQYRLYLDPDPRLLDPWSESVRVYSGDLTSLTSFEGTTDRACAEADAAWDAHGDRERTPTGQKDFTPEEPWHFDGADWMRA